MDSLAALQELFCISARFALVWIHSADVSAVSFFGSCRSVCLQILPQCHFGFLPWWLALVFQPFCIFWGVTPCGLKRAARFDVFSLVVVTSTRSLFLSCFLR